VLLDQTSGGAAPRWAWWASLMGSMGSIDGLARIFFCFLILLTEASIKPS